MSIKFKAARLHTGAKAVCHNEVVYMSDTVSARESLLFTV